MLLKLFGAERVAFGSDYPFSLGETHPGKLIESMKLSEKEKGQLFPEQCASFWESRERLKRLKGLR